MFLFFKKNKNYFLDGAFLFFLTILFFMRWLFQDRYMIFTSDVIQDFSMHHFAAEAFRQGQIPLWDPYFTWAFVAYLNSGVFYPFNLIMNFVHAFFINNLNFAYLLMQWNAFFHYFLASLFMYILVRNFKISRFAAIIAGIIFAYSGYLVKEYVHIQYLQGGIWLPLVFLFFYRSIFEKLRFAVFAGIFLGLSLLAGQTQPGIYYIITLIVLTFYAVFHLYQYKEKKYLKPIITLLITSLVAFGIFAIQFFSTWEYVKYSTRQQFDYNYSVAFSAQPLYLIIHPFIPTFWGGMPSKFWNGTDVETMPLTDRPLWLDSIFGGLPNEMNFYIGLLPFFLLPFAFFSKNKFLRNLFLIILFFSILLMISQSITLIGRLFYYIVGGNARVPVRASFLFTFSLAFLSAMGIQAIFDLKEKRKDIFKKITQTNCFILGSLSLFVLPLLISLLLSSAGNNKMTYFYFPMINAFSLFLIYFLIYSLLMFFLIRVKEIKLILIGIITILIIDLFSFHMNNSYIIPSNGSPAGLLGPYSKPEISYLKNDKDFFRVSGLGLAAYTNNLFSLGYGTTGSTGFAYRPALELFNLITDDASPLLDLMNVKYFYVSENRKIKDLVSSINSSSFLSDHRPYDAFDGDPDTEWVINPNSAKEATDWIEINLRKPENITHLEILGRDNDRDKEIKDIELVFSDGSSQKISLPSRKGWKSIKINPVQTTSIKFIIEGFDTIFGNNDNYGLKEVNIFNTDGNKVEIGSSKWQKIPGFNLYQNQNVMPRVFTTYSYKQFNDRDQMFDAIEKDKNGQDMKKNVYLYTKPLNFENPVTASSEQSKAEIKEYKLRKVTIEADMKASGFLILSDIWYPGWKASIDGKEATIYSAYQTLRTVQVPQGKHIIVFEYDPASFKTGFIITFITITGLLLYFFIPKFIHRKSA